MSKSRQPTPQNHTESSTEFTQPSVEQVSNQHQVEQASITDGGVAATEMGLSGPFAEMILDCMPLIAAVPIAAQCQDNPSVQTWARRQSLTEVAKSLRSAANQLMQQLWPIGLGLCGEGAIKGQLAFGAQGAVQYDAKRTAVDELALTANTVVAADLAGGAVGASLTDAFGDTATAMMAEAQLQVGTDTTAQTTIDFDVLSILEAASGPKGMSLADAFGGGPAFLMDPAALRGFVEQDATKRGEWSFGHSTWMQSSARASAVDLDSELADDLAGILPQSAPLGTLVELLVPILDMAGAARMSIDHREDGTFALTGGFSCEVALQLFTNHPLLRDRVSSDVLDFLEQGASADASARVELVLEQSKDLGALWVPSIEACTLTITQTKDTHGVTVTDERTVGLADTNMSEGQSSGEMDALGSIGSLRRQMAIDLDAELMDQACPATVRNLLGITETFTQCKSSIQLVGSAILSQEAVTQALPALNLQSNGQLLIAMDLAMAIASGHPYPLSDDMKHAEEAIHALAEQVQFTGARLIGTMMQGQGGEVGIDVGAQFSAGARAAAGVTIDHAVSDEDAGELRKRLMGDRSAA